MNALPISIKQLTWKPHFLSPCFAHLRNNCWKDRNSPSFSPSFSSLSSFPSSFVTIVSFSVSLLLPSLPSFSSSSSLSLLSFLLFLLFLLSSLSLLLQLFFLLFSLCLHMPFFSVFYIPYHDQASACFSSLIHSPQQSYSISEAKRFFLPEEITLAVSSAQMPHSQICLSPQLTQYPSGRGDRHDPPFLHPKLLTTSLCSFLLLYCPSVAIFLLLYVVFLFCFVFWFFFLSVSPQIEFKHHEVNCWFYRHSKNTCCWVSGKRSIYPLHVLPILL